MSPPNSVALYNHSTGDHHVFHAAALDVWVAWDGGTVIIMQGVGGQDRPYDDDDDAGSDSPKTPDGVAFPDETSVTLPAVTADGLDTSPTTLSASQPPTQSSMGSPSISPSTGLSTVMSETQAPSSLAPLPTSSTTETVSSVLQSSQVGPPPSASPPVSTSSVPQNTSSSAPVSPEPTTTILAPPPPTSSEYLSHTPPFYVAIALGSIAGVAILAALVAWAVRKQIHEKQRRLVDAAVKLPWVHSTGGNDDSGFPVALSGADIETGMRSMNTEVGIMNLGSLEDMAHVQAWEPRGDRDVGEPKRAGYNYVDRKPRPPFIAQEIPSHMLFPGYVNKELVNDASAFPCANRVSLGTIDMHLPMETLGGGSALLITNQLPGDISASSSQEAAVPSPSNGTAPFYPELGTPRELVPMPRFLGLDGKGLSLPWEEKSQTMTEGHTGSNTRSRIMSPGHIRSTWERQASKPTAVENLIVEDKPVERGAEEGGWAMSIRSNFASALNAVAAGFPASINGDGKEVSDKLALVPPRRASTRELLRDTTLMLLGNDTAKASLSRGSTTKSAVSNPWSLVETGTNTGVVHIHMPTLDMCSVSSHEISDPGYGLPRSYMLRDHQPLRVKKKVSMPLSKHRSSTSTRDSRSRISASRSSSAIGYGSPKRYKSTISSSMKRRLTLEKRSVLSSRTSLLTSTPSTASTTTASSIVTGTEGSAKRRALAREVLKVRRRKARQFEETSVGQVTI